jgi:hypothetical protein
MKTQLAPQVPQKTVTADEVMRIRMRYNKALRAGMSVAEATAYANDPGLAEPSVPAGVAQVELAAAPPAANGRGGPHLAGDSESVATEAPLSREPTLSASTETTAHNEKIDAHRLVHHPYRVVFQARHLSRVRRQAEIPGRSGGARGQRRAEMDGAVHRLHRRMGEERELINGLQPLLSSPACRRMRSRSTIICSAAASADGWMSTAASSPSRLRSRWMDR